MISNTKITLTGTPKQGKHFSIVAYDGPTNDAAAGAADASTKIKTQLELTGAFLDFNLSIKETPIA